MGSAIKKSAEQMNQERRATKQKRRQSRKQKQEGFSFNKGDFDFQGKEAQRQERERKQAEWEEKQKRRRIRDDIQFGRAVQAEINRLLDLVDAAGRRGVDVEAEVTGLSDVRDQVIRELIGWLDQNPERYQYAPHKSSLYVARL